MNKLCIKCKNCIYKKHDYYCIRKIGTNNIYSNKLCSIERKNERLCGPTGKFFEEIT